MSLMSNSNNKKKHTEQIQRMQKLHGDLILDEEAVTTYYSNWWVQSSNDIYYDDQQKHQVAVEKEQDTVIVNKEEKGVQHNHEQVQNMTNAFYDLVTDFYECGDTFEENIKRHEAFLAIKLGSTQGQRDVGYGVSGPLREIVKTCGYAHVTGINNNAYQIELFSVEATVHAPRLEIVYSEIYCVLRPGGRFACYEWCSTSKYDPLNKPIHRQVVYGIKEGNSISKLYSTDDCLKALEVVVFEILEQHDTAIIDQATIPWYYSLKKPEGLRGLLRSPLGRYYTHSLLTVMSKFKLVPPGVLETSELLNNATDALVAGGEMGIFTPISTAHIEFLRPNIFAFAESQFQK
ncbi:hypothetical protein BDC45DRAFT_567770 [Circinella umbellata]|nr:hypothetical protein BDC45DRAFT_567770 [Circinella umbellata]